MLEQRIIPDPELASVEEADRAAVEGIRKTAWDAYLSPLLEERAKVLDMLDEVGMNTSHASELEKLKKRLAGLPSVTRRDVHMTVHEALRILRRDENPVKQILVNWKNEQDKVNDERYGSHLYSGTALAVADVQPVYSKDSPTVMGFEVMNAAFDKLLEKEPRLIAFGEDVGFLGDVNQGFRGMQEKYGALRVTDTGIREATILGQAIGMAMRGLRPICGDPVSRLSAVRPATDERRPGDPPLAHRWRAESAGHRAHARAPPGGHLALRLANGGHHQSGTRHVRAGAQKYGESSWLL